MRAAHLLAAGALAAAALGLPRAHALGAQDDDDALFDSYVEHMETALRRLEDATYQLHKREWVDGEFTDEQVLNVRFRVPDDVYIVYGGSKEGRRVLYQGSDWNQGKLRVDPGPLLPTLDLGIRSSVAMDGELYTVREVRLNHPSATISRNCQTVREHPSWIPQVEDLGPKTITGRQARCFDTRSPRDQDPSLYAYRTLVCFDEQTHFPIELTSWDVMDGEMRKREWYRYDALQVNVGLTDADFDADALDI